MYLHTMHEKVHRLMSYNAILNFIIDNRDTGKSTQFKKRALCRLLKHHTMTIWVRRFKNEIKECKREFLNDKFFAVLENDYPNKFNREDFKIKGNYATYKNVPFVYFVNCKMARADKGIDAENIDTIVFDEFMATDTDYNHYRGDEVSDFFTIFFTKKRTHADGSQSQIYIYMLGNRDSYHNPFYTYFNLPPLPIEFEGIKTFRNGSIAVMQLNSKPKDASNIYDKKLNALLKNTPLDAYRNGNILNAVIMDFVKPSKNAEFYAQFDCGYKMSMVIEKSKIYVVRGIDTSRCVFTDKPKNEYKKNFVINASDKNIFSLLTRMYKKNCICYDSALSYREALKLFELLNII